MTQKRKRKSESLTPDEHTLFKSLYNSFPTKVDAEDHIGLIRQILDGVYYKGSGSPDTIKAIRRKLKSYVPAGLNVEGK